MAFKNTEKADRAFKKAKRALKPWEKTAAENAKKTERLRALRLAKEAAERDGTAAPADADKAQDKAET